MKVPSSMYLLAQNWTRIFWGTRLARGTEISQLILSGRLSVTRSRYYCLRLRSNGRRDNGPHQLNCELLAATTDPCTAAAGSEFKQSSTGTISIDLRLSTTAKEMAFIKLGTMMFNVADKGPAMSRGDWGGITGWHTSSLGCWRSDCLVA